MDETLRKRLVALTAAGRAQSLDFESVAARVATDRFLSLSAPSPEDRARYEELMLGAAARLDATNAHRIAAQLAPCPAAPVAVLERLVALGPTVAAIVLAAAPSLASSFLLARAREGDAVEAAAIAARSDIDRTIVAALAQRLEPEVLHALAANRGAALDRGALIALTQRARVDIELGRLLLARDEPALDRMALFLSADATTRRAILLDAMREALATSGAGDLSLAFDGLRLEAVAAADSSDLARFSSVIARALRLSRAAIDRLVQDDGGEALGLLFAAMGLAATESDRRVGALRPDLAQALADPVSGLRFAMQAPPQAAACILAALIPGRQPRRQGEYAPMQPGARTSATQTPQIDAAVRALRKG